MQKIIARTPGRIIEIRVKEKEPFQARQTLAVLEAMKMEQPVFSRCGGTVREICVSVGDFVKMGQVLLTVEERERETGVSSLSPVSGDRELTPVSHESVKKEKNRQ